MNESILTHFKKKKISQIVIGVEIDRRRRARYTSSGDSGMKSSQLRHIFLGLSSYMKK